jgi:hypothetical protein
VHFTAFSETRQDKTRHDKTRQDGLKHSKVPPFCGLFSQVKISRRWKMSPPSSGLKSKLAEGTSMKQVVSMKQT